MVKWSHGRYYYDFLEQVEILREEDNTCFICGCDEDVKPHHIRRVKESDKMYASKSNIVLLCKYHHNLFHKSYGSGKGVNRENFNNFVKNEHLKEINLLKDKIRTYEDTIKLLDKYIVVRDSEGVILDSIRELVL